MNIHTCFKSSFNMHDFTSFQCNIIVTCEWPLDRNIVYSLCFEILFTNIEIVAAQFSSMLLVCRCPELDLCIYVRTETQM